MESAYLYVRVSTDEQKKTGYSLIEQEERLLNVPKKDGGVLSLKQQALLKILKTVGIE